MRFELVGDIYLFLSVERKLILVFLLEKIMYIHFVPAVLLLFIER